MRNQITKQVAGGRVAASLAVAMAPAPETREAAVFVNDRGELMTVDPPNVDHKPVYIALPLRADADKSVDKPTAMPAPKR